MSDNNMIQLTVRAEAILAVLDQSFICKDPEDSDFGRRIVHCYSGSIGADWDEHRVIDCIRNARTVAWTTPFIGHELAVVTEDGNARSFDITRPSQVPLLEPDSRFYPDLDAEDGEHK